MAPIILQWRAEFTSTEDLLYERRQWNLALKFSGLICETTIYPFGCIAHLGVCCLTILS